MTHHTPRLSIGPLNRIRRRLHHSIILGLTALTTATATTLCSTSTIPTAHADALPNFPTNPIAKARWVNPNLRPGEEASNYKIEILRVSQHIKLGEELKVTLKVVNNSPESIAGFKIVPAHADAPKDLATARIVLSQEPGAYPYQAKTISRDDIIAPGHSVDIDVIIPTAPGATGGFNISEADFYPVLFALRSLENDALLYTQRFLLNVNAKNTTGSGATTGATHQGNSGTNTGGQTADTNSKTSSQLSPGVTVVYPLTATVDSVGGETGEAPNHPPLILESEQLAEQLRSGGRLDTLLKDYSTYTKASESLATATCLAIDPQLVSVVERMAGGYTIAHDRPSTVSQKRRLRDSWGTDDEPESGTPGTGADDAGRWLAELRKTAQHAKCTIALPWGNTDLNSVAATGNDWLMREAVQTGPGIIANILGITPETNIVIPGAGYVTTQAAGNLGWADLAPYRSRDEYPNISDEWQKDSKQVGAPIPTAPVDVLVADNTVWGIPKVDRFGVLDTAGMTKNATNSNIGGGIRAVTYLGSLAASLAEATDTATTVGYSNYNARFNYDLDSLPARRATATSALQMSVMKANNEGSASDSRGGAQGDSLISGAISGASSPQPLLVQLPSAMSNTAQWLDALVKMFESNAATPMKLSDYVSPSLQQVEQLASMAAATSAATSAAADAATEAATDADDQQRITQSAQTVQSERSARLAGSVRPVSSVDSQRTQRAPAPTTAATGAASAATTAEQPQPNSTPFGAPHEDPGVISDSEIFRATSLLESIDNLTQLVISDPTIALTPYGFTEPLRQDILRALSRDRRRAMSTYDTNVRDVQRLLDNEDIVLKELRSSVALIPPGNVYTRISESSPLLIVARNGLPLPVDTRIHYWGPTGAKINMPETIFIPAKGSITVQMTASLPTDTAWDERTDLNLWLATNSGSRFSDEITIGVRTRSGVLGTSGSLASLAVIVLSIALLGRLTLRRRKAKSEAAADSKSTVSTNSD